MKTLFVTGAPHPSDDFIIQQLKQVAPDLDVHTAAGGPAALTELRSSASYRVVVTAPGLGRHEALTLIAHLRRDQSPIAIASVVNEPDQDATILLIAQGADDVVVMRDGTLLFAPAAVMRLRQSPHLRPTDSRQHLRVLYAGQDAAIGDLLDRMPFVKVERAECDAEGNLPVRSSTPGDDRLRCDVVVIDVPAADADPLRLVRSVRAHASDLPITVLTGPERFEVGTSALDLGAEGHIVKMGGFKRRLVATLHRLHERLQITAQHALLRSREARARHIVECIPDGLAVIGQNGTVHAINNAGLPFGGAAKTSDLVGIDFCSLVAAGRGDEVRALLSRTASGEPLTFEVELQGLDGLRRSVDVCAAPIAHDVRGVRAAVAVLRTHVAAPAPTDTPETLAELARTVAGLQNATAKCQSLEQRLAEARAALGTAQTRNAALEIARTDADEALKTSQSDLEAAQAAVQELQQRRAALESTAVADRDALDAALARAAALEAAQTSAESALRVAKVEFDAAMAADRAASDAAHRQLQTELDVARLAARAAHDRDQAEIHDLRRTSHEQRTVCDNLEAALHDARTSADDRLASAEASHGAVRLSLERQLHEATSRLDDLTERSQAWRTLEDRLMQARRIEEVGRLAASMMPDVEGLVSSIAECGEQLAAGLSESDPRRESARALREHTARTASLVRQLMAFSVRLAQPASPIDLNDAVTQAEPLLRRIVGGHIAFDVYLGASSMITASQGDLDQLLTALVGAVGDGLPVGGLLTLATARVDTESTTGTADPNAASGTAAQVAVRGWGYGIEPTEPSRALALAVARCGGQLRVDSDSRSASLVVSLPIRASGAAHEMTDGERTTRSGGTVIEASAERFAARRSAS